MLRPFPWPYRAALAFSNDCDFMTLPAMLGVHHLFGAAESEGGLGLECSDSFFFFHRGEPPAYSYFDGYTARPGAAAPVIRELVAAGYLDTTHALGDFTSGGFNRSKAQHALAEFKKHGLSLPVWSNHGGFGNLQNIGSKDFAYHHSGDDIHRPFYVLDIAEDLGVHYFWRDGFISRRMPLQPTGPVVGEHERRAPREVRIDGVIGIQPDYRIRPTHDRSEVFDSIATRAGSKLQGFARYHCYLPDSDATEEAPDVALPDGRRPAPNIGRIADSLTSRLLDDLVAAQACVFLYQHFGVLTYLPERRFLSDAIEFHPSNLDALRRLKSYEDRGQIWVPAQAILLDYLYAANTVDARPKRADEIWQIEVTPKAGYALRDVSGLTVEVPRPAEKAIFALADGRTREGNVAGPDGDGKFWAYLPVRRLPRIDWPAVARLAGIQLPGRPRVTLLNGSKPPNLNWPGFAA